MNYWRIGLVAALGVQLSFCSGAHGASSSSTNSIHKIRDFVIYKDDKFYCAFPSVVKRKGDLIVAFRRAPDRRKWGEPTYTHVDPNSYLMLVRSRDDGKTWTKEPELIYAHPFGGSQDPGLNLLRDGSILCSSYVWGWYPSGTTFPHVFAVQGYVFLGGYMMRSIDGGHTWERPIIPPPVPTEQVWDVFHKQIPAFNRGAMAQGKDGRLYWATASSSGGKTAKSETHLFISSDKGQTWKYSCKIASDEKVGFNETSLYETPKGDLVAFMRTTALREHTALARSTNHGKSFLPWKDAGFTGYPHHALRLSDDRVLLMYGYRFAPYGVRARVLDPECANLAVDEMILRDDGGGEDVGYPWATLLDKKTALVVYYFNEKEGPRYIGGTILGLK